MIDIDYAKIGQILYSNMSEEQQSCVSIGMIPVEIMHSATNTFKDVIVGKMMKNLDIDPSDVLAVDLIKNTIRPKAIKDFRRNIVVSIFDAAKSVNRMIA